MKKTFATAFIFLLAVSCILAQSGLTRTHNVAFAPGELLKYRVHYGFIDAGEATLEVKPHYKDFGGRACYHVVGTGRSMGAFDWFFKVRDTYESYIDTQAMVPWLFIRRTNEGGYTINQNVSFNHLKKTATSEKKTIETPSRVQDLVSACYYARTIDFSKATPGDTFVIHTYLDDETFPLTIKFIGRETLKTAKGKIRCIVFRPMLLEGRVFKEKEGMTMWVSDDKNRIPVRAQANILVGSIKMDLKDYQGLLNPLAKE